MSTLKPVATAPVEKNVAFPPDARNIMVAVDGSDGSRKAFDYALKEIVRDTAKDVVHLCYFYPTVKIRDGDHTPLESELKSAMEQHETSLHNEGMAILQNYGKSCEDAGLHWKPHVLPGKGQDVRDTIVDFANHLNPVTLVVGSRGHGALKRMLVGSLSTYCVHFCTCPVLVVR